MNGKVHGTVNSVVIDPETTDLGDVETEAFLTQCDIEAQKPMRKMREYMNDGRPFPSPNHGGGKERQK